MLNNSSGISIDSIKGIAVFKIGDKLFSLNLDYLIASISPKDANTSNVFILSKEKVIKYNQDVYMLIDLHAFFGLSVNPGGIDSQIILFEFAGERGAFFADSIEEIITFTRFVKEYAKVIPPAEEGFSQGELVIDGLSVTLPDFKNIFAHLKN